MNALAIGLFAVAAVASAWTVVASWIQFAPKFRALRAELAWQDIELRAQGRYAQPRSVAATVRKDRAVRSPARAATLPLPVLTPVRPMLAA